jgi:cytochrome c biogenesis factor
MGLALFFAATGMPGSFWDSPSNVTAAILLGVGLVTIGLALALARVFKRFNGLAWALLLAGIAICGYGAWRMLG